MPSSGPHARNAAFAKVERPQFDPGPEAIQCYERFKEQVAKAVPGDVQDKLNSVLEQLNFHSSPDILSRRFSVILEIIEAVAILAIETVDIVVEAAISLLKVILTAARAFVDQAIDIPYVTDFYRWLTSTPDNHEGENHSFLNLTTLLVAIPACFARNLMRREPAYLSGVSPEPPGPSRGVRITDKDLGALQVTAGAWAIG
jgi:hypothetical protein